MRVYYELNTMTNEACRQLVADAETAGHVWAHELPSFIHDVDKTVVGMLILDYDSESMTMSWDVEGTSPDFAIRLMDAADSQEAANSGDAA